MIKEVNIGGKSVVLKSSAFTMFAYRDFTSRKLLEDIQNISESLSNANDKELIAKFDDVLDILLKITYVMAKEQDESIVGFKDWSKGFDDLFSNTEWIKEVLSTAIAPFRRSL